MNRIIGKYKGSEEGPLLVITAAMHGNEPAGVKALDLLFKMLEVEPVTNPDFVYKGEILGLIGNVQAYNSEKRFIFKDINRCWNVDFIKALLTAEESSLQDEDREIRQVMDHIYAEIEMTKARKLYLLDLHTTSSDGGIFCIATDIKESIRIAHDIHAPVILGLMKDIEGTTLHYFTETNMGIPTVAVAFEGGQHNDPISVRRCIAAVINVMRAIEVISPEHVENQHDRILQEYSASLPEVVEVIYKFPIEDNHTWQMKPGYKNFQKVKKGEVLAMYDGKEVCSPSDGLILMPLYQAQGSDGFFLVKEVIEW